MVREMGETRPERGEALLTIVQGWLESTGPTTAEELAGKLSLSTQDVNGVLLQLESQGQVLRGRFRPNSALSTHDSSLDSVEWCDRRLLARIHRLTIGKLRREIEPVTAAEFMRFLFQVPIHGSVLLLALLALPYLFAALSLGILISSKANSQAEAMQLAFLPILPSVFFSGYIFPRETMPALFKPISYLIPATYFINITRGIILRGAGIKHLWTDGLALFAIGTILLIIAARRFQNKVIMA